MNEISTILRESYPPTLANMKYPPRRLYYRGRFPAPVGHRYLCVVGSRKWTSYGRDAVNKVISGLKGYPITIVSGLAIGIDSIAHVAALNAKLHCVAFPGSSLDWDSIYPREHLDLARRIVAGGGALVSRWDIGYETGKWAFPARNQLMAGLSHATLIVEAAEHSGSLMTADHSTEFNRDVFAIPGPIFSPTSYGPHMLIRHGAALISSSADLLKELGFEPSGIENDREGQLRKLDEASLMIVKALTNEEANTDDLTERTGLRLAVLNEKLSYLEMEGMVKNDDGVMHLIM